MKTQEPAAVDGRGVLRVRVDLAYDGTSFAGWARQPGLRTVQGSVESALAVVLRQQAPLVTCAGRTDAGVHARGQVTHVDLAPGVLEACGGRTPQQWPAVLLRRLNAVLDDDVRVRDVALAPAGFDARFAALWRRYAYRVRDETSLPDPLTRGYVWSHAQSLDLSAMNDAAARLRGVHEFAAYCRARQGATTVRDLQQLSWSRDQGGLAVLHVQADAFCHHMVRGLVGALVRVGEGRQPVTWPAALLDATERQPSVPVSPAHGLTLEEVGYPGAAELAARAATTRAGRPAVASRRTADSPHR